MVTNPPFQRLGLGFSVKGRRRSRTCTFPHSANSSRTSSKRPPHAPLSSLELHWDIPKTTTSRTFVPLVESSAQRLRNGRKNEHPPNGVTHATNEFVRSSIFQHSAQYRTHLWHKGSSEKFPKQHDSFPGNRARVAWGGPSPRQWRVSWNDLCYSCPGAQDPAEFRPITGGCGAQGVYE